MITLIDDPLLISSLVSCCRAQRGGMLLCSNVHALHTAGRPPSRTIPMAKLRVLRHGLEGDEFQSAKIAVAHAPVLRGGAHVLSLVGTRTRRILDNVAQTRGIEYTVVRIDVFLPTSRRRTWWVVADSPVLLVAVIAASSLAPKDNPILRREVVSARIIQRDEKTELIGR